MAFLDASKTWLMGRMEVKRSLVYKFHFMFSVIVSPLTLLLFYFVWSSIYRNSPTPIIMGYTFSDMITYYVLTMIIGHFIFSMAGDEIQDKIINGELNQDLLKPMPVFSQMLARQMGERIFALVVEVIPVFIVSFVLFRLKFVSLPATAFFAVSLVMAFFINFLLSYALGTVAFWVNKIESLQWIFFMLVRFLSGEFVPLEFLG